MPCRAGRYALQSSTWCFYCQWHGEHCHQQAGVYIQCHDASGGVLAQAQAGDLAPSDLAETFNCGIGMVVVVESESAQAIMDMLTSSGETVYKLGVLAERTSEAVEIKGF